MPIPIRHLHHIARETTDVARSLAFYEDVLGFKKVWRPNFDFDGAWLFAHGVMIHLIKGNPPSRDSSISSRADHVAFHVDDVKDVERWLVDHDIPYKRTTQADTGMTQLFFHDPDGNHIEIGCYGPVRELAAEP